jgi:ATP-dependent Clp protease ATP-binding subunit ClpB
MHNFDSVILGALDLAQIEVFNRKNANLMPIHLLYGLLKNPQGLSKNLLSNYKKEIEKKLEQLPKLGQKVASQDLKMSSDLSEWITYANGHAIQNGRKEIKEMDFLLYLEKYFPEFKFDMNQANLDNGEEAQEVPAFLVNLNERAEKGELDPVIGRTKEIRSVMEILGRRRKNNPVLVGPAGVGKTAIVEGLAEAIVKGQVPDVLKDKTIYNLDLGALMAGTKFRGEFEERLQNLLKFMKNKHGLAVLFIDEIHQLVGAGKTDGAMDAANLLKPALARGELHCIGATTEDEYQKYILGDSALARRFRSVSVNEPDIDDSIEILMGLKEKLEGHHGVKISDDAIYHAVHLSEKYITDKNLPDKAIDLVDEAASCLKISAEAMPTQLVELEAEIRNKSILAQIEKDNQQILNDISDLKEKLVIEKKQWEQQVLSLKKVSEIKGQLEKLKFDLEKAERQADYEKASQLKYASIPEKEKELSLMSHDWILKKEDIAKVIATNTGVPINKIMANKQQEILELGNFLKTQVFGQEGALEEVAGVLKASYAGLSDETRPLGSFLLLGPSGVGKTETVKSVTRYLFNSEKNLVRFDLSEFSEKHSVAKLIGSPPGYIGHDDGGVLTEAIRRHPYSVILFDEVEKAHPDFADILLQMLDDGRLTDNKGRTINFKNTVIFMTSNSKDYKAQFKPEILGRIDAILTYRHLAAEVGVKLVSKQVKLLNERLKSKKIVVEISDTLKNELLKRGVSEEYGARPLAALFSKIVIRPLSEQVLAGSLNNKNILLDFGDDDQLLIKDLP